MPESSEQAVLKVRGDEFELPVRTPTAGPDVIDIRSLYAKTGMFTYDPGYMSTASCDSEITFIDGEAGKLLHRGYRIEHLAENASYLEVCYLLLYGELPKRSELREFEERVTMHTMVHEQMRNFFNGFRRDAHPMAIITGVMGAMSAFYHDSLDINDPQHCEIASIRMIAKLPTIVAMAYKYSLGQPFIYPSNDVDYASNFLRMCFAVPASEWERSPAISRAMDRIFILHADHEQNASTSTVRLAGSSGANPFACIAAGIACLWGPAHGGANEACLRMLKEIGTADRIPDYVNRAKDPADPFRLVGFGHRVYKNFDPRSQVLKHAADEILESISPENRPILELARELEQFALQDEYFVKRKLYPNVDFYSGIILDAIGFPTSMFTPIFALSRTVGWISQWKEMIADPSSKIGRPRQLYTGPGDRAFVKLADRE